MSNVAIFEDTYKLILYTKVKEQNKFIEPMKLKKLLILIFLIITVNTKIINDNNGIGANLK
ncbi:MAG: hypothetical protein ACP6IY_21560 [Promethearchaeia archaeon]